MRIVGIIVLFAGFTAFAHAATVDPIAPVAVASDTTTFTAVSTEAVQVTKIQTVTVESLMAERADFQSRIKQDSEDGQKYQDFYNGRIAFWQAQVDKINAMLAAAGAK